MKVPKNFTIKEELIPLIKKEAEEKNRSESFIVDEILTEYFKNKKVKK